MIKRIGLGLLACALVWACVYAARPGGLSALMLSLSPEAQHARKQELVEEYWTGAEAHLEKWDDAVELAMVTPWITLGDRIVELQELHREWGAIKPPEEAKMHHFYITKAEEEILQAFLDFQDDSDADIVAYFEAAELFRLRARQSRPQF